MKREASYLEKELHDVIESITSLQKQNVEFKSYMTSLVNNNNHNAQVCRLQIQGFHEELKVVHDEILLLQKYDNHGDYHNNNKNKICIDYKKIDEVLERADSVCMMPIISNDVKTLAFTKLRNAIRRTFLLENIDKVLRNFYNQRVLSISLCGWKTYVDNKLLGLKLQQQVRIKIRRHVLQQWKILTANKRISDTNVMKRNFKIWMKITRWRLWSTFKAETFRNKLYASQFFQAWKSQCTFLDWGNLVIATRYQHAGSYFLRRMFYEFINTVKKRKDNENDKVWKISNKLKTKCYRIWLLSCEKKWQRRGQLIRMFFTNITSLVWIKHRIIHFKREAIRFWSGSNKRLVLQKWALILRHKNKQLSQNQCRKLNKLHLMNMFKFFKARVYTTSKLSRSNHRSILKYDFFSKRHSFKVLSLYCLIQRKRRWKCDKFLLKKFTNRWKKFMASVGDLKQMKAKVIAYRKKRNISTMVLIFNTFYKLKEKRNRYNRYQKIIAWKTHKHLMSCHFKYMKSTWSSRLYNALNIKKSKSVASNESLRNIQNKRQQLLFETEEKREKIHDYEGKIMELQKIVLDNRSDLENTATALLQEELFIDNLSKEYEETLQKISTVIQEHNKYKNVDHLMGVRKMYEDLRKVALEKSSQGFFDDSSVEEKSMNSYDASESLGFDDASEETATLKDVDNASQHNTNSNINNTYDVARTSINRIANKFKKKLTLE